MKTIVITGASSGIGSALAVLWAQRGCRVVLIARREDRLNTLATTVELAGGSPRVLVADLTHESECLRVVEELADETVDVLINNAGRGNYASIEDTSTDSWRQMFALNVDAPFFLTRGLLGGMKQRDLGHIVNVSSVAGRQGFPFNAAYVAAKHAVVGLTAALRAELVDSNVHATVVCPAGVSTEWADATEGGSIGALYSAAIPRSRTLAREQGLSLAPLFHMMPAEEVAAIILRTVDAGRSNDIFTHDGTEAHAVQSVTDRIGLEDAHRALWLAMKETYGTV